MKITSQQSILVVLVNYGDEQLSYLNIVIAELRKFKKYKVKIIVNSNIEIANSEIDILNIIDLLDYQLLPLTCRKIIWENRDDFDVFIYGENDHLFLEKHVDNHLYYSSILPENRIAGLIQFEENETGRYFPGYHFDFEWDFCKVETYDNKKFAHFSNLHQASFILTKKQLKKTAKRFNFNELFVEKNIFSRVEYKIKSILRLKVDRQDKYSVKCKVNTDIYNYGGMKKLICISDFEENLIHHLPNIYIDGLRGRNKYRSEEVRMNESIEKLLSIK